MAGVSLPLGGFETSAFESTGFYTQQPLPFATAGQGSLTKTVSVALTGLSTTAGQGALAKTAAKSITGQGTTAGQGAVAKTVQKILAGQGATSASGVVTPTVLWAMSGLGAVAGQGTTQQLYYPLPGLTAYDYIGDIGVLITPTSTLYVDSETLLVFHEERRLLVEPETQSVSIPAAESVLYVLAEEDEAAPLRG